MNRVALIAMILALVSGAYGICILLTRSGSRFYLIWILLAAILGTLSMAAWHGILPRIPLAIRVVCSVVVLLAVLVVAITFALMLSQFHAAGENDPNVIIALGAQVRTDGPSRVLRYRLDTAYDYLEAHPQTICIVSGGQGSNEPEPEAEGMARYLIERGIAPDRILLENQSENTVQNLQYSAALLNPASDRIAIITNNFHVYRSLALARAAGYRNVSGIAAPSSPFYLPNNMLRETCGILKDWAMGNL